jgi:hypothetical protein
LVFYVQLRKRLDNRSGETPMLAFSLLAIMLSIPAPTRHPARLAGIWVSNPAKSDWGGAPLPRQLVLEVEQSERHLAILEITTAFPNRRISYRQVTLAGAGCAGDQDIRIVPGASCYTSANNAAAEERWEISTVGELIITRQESLGPKMVQQRIVLEPSAPATE